MARKIWPERLHGDINHSSTKTGNVHKGNRGQGLPHPTRSSRRLWKDAPETVLHDNRGVSGAGRYIVHGLPQRCHWNTVQDHLCPVWIGSPKIKMPSRVDEPRFCGISKTSLIN